MTTRILLKNRQMDFQIRGQKMTVITMISPLNIRLDRSRKGKWISIGYTMNSNSSTASKKTVSELIFACSEKHHRGGQRFCFSGPQFVYRHFWLWLLRQYHIVRPVSEMLRAAMQKHYTTERQFSWIEINGAGSRIAYVSAFLIISCSVFQDRSGKNDRKELWFL